MVSRRAPDALLSAVGANPPAHQTRIESGARVVEQVLAKINWGAAHEAVGHSVHNLIEGCADGIDLTELQRDLSAFQLHFAMIQVR